MEKSVSASLVKEIDDSHGVPLMFPQAFFHDEPHQQRQRHQEDDNRRCDKYGAVFARPSVAIFPDGDVIRHRETPVSEQRSVGAELEEPVWH